MLSALAESAKQLEAERWKVYVVKEGVKGVYAEREEKVLRELEEAGALVISIESQELDWLKK